LFQDGTLESHLFDFLNKLFNATGRTTDKLRKLAKNGILISNALFIARATNKK